eukprot:6017294-Pyramimonas_sp.AAC.1
MKTEKNVIFRIFWLSLQKRCARKELYEVPGGNLVDGLPPVPNLMCATHAGGSTGAFGESLWGTKRARGVPSW